MGLGLGLGLGFRSSSHTFCATIVAMSSVGCHVLA